MPTIRAEIIKGKVVCPECGHTDRHDDYGVHCGGYWFSFVCPGHKRRHRTIVKYYTDFDFNILED